MAGTTGKQEKYRHIGGFECTAWLAGFVSNCGGLEALFLDFSPATFPGRVFP